MNRFLLLSITLLFASCSAFKPQQATKKVIEGSYTIVERKPNSSNPKFVITGTVYDKESNTPIKGAVVQIEALKNGGFTDELGHYTLEVEGSGQQKIQVKNVGHTQISTEPIKLEGETKVEINFYLGITIEY